MNRLPVAFLLAVAAVHAQTSLRIDSISPNSATAGSPNLTLTIDGSGFGSDSQVFWRWGSLFPSPLPSTVISPNRISAIVNTSLLATPGSIAVAVRRASDAAVSNSVTFTVHGGFAIQTSCPLPDAVVGTIYSQTLTAQGGATPYAWSLFSGGLPTGLQLSTAGVISGTPSAVGQFDFGINVRDAGGQSANSICSIRVTQTPETSNLAITSLAPPGTVAGSGDTTVEIRGIGFLQGATAVWSSSSTQQTDLATTYQNPSILTAVVPATLLAGQGNFGIAVRQVSLTRQVFSNTQPFLVAGPLQLTTTCPLSDAAIDTDYSQRLVANGGFSPYQFTVSSGNLATGLRVTGDTVAGRPTDAGAFNFTITVTDSRGNAISRGCSMRVLGPMSVAPASIEVSSSSGGLPVSVDLSLTTPAPGADVSATVSTQTGGTWIRTAVTPGRTPALARITIDPATLPPGVFRGQVTINTNGATNRFVTVPVTFTVTAPELTQLSALPAVVRFAASRDFHSTTPKGILVSNAAETPLSFNVTYSAPWLSVSPESGVASLSSPVPLTVRANPGSLTAGTYRSEIVISSGSVRTTVAAVLVIGSSPEVLTVSKSGLTYTAVQGGPSPQARQVHVLPGGNDYFWEPQLPLDGANAPHWIADPVANASRPGQITSSALSPDTSVLEAGLYQGEIRVSAPSAGNAVHFVSANVVVLPPATIPPPEPETGAIGFLTNAGLNPAPRQIQLRNPSRSQMAIDVQLAGDAGIFSLNTDSPRQVAPGQTRTIEVSANSASLAPGVYRASLAVQGSGSTTVQLVDIVLTVVSPLLCTPSRYDILPLSLPANFTAVGGVAADIEVAVRDNCGNPLPSNGVVMVTSTTRPAAVISLVNTGEDHWSGSWLVTQTSAGPVRLWLSAAGGGITSTHQISGTITANPNQPVLLPDAIVSVASYAQGPLTPGGAVAAFGNGLATTTTSVSPPLQVRLGGSQVLMGDRETALYAVSPGQLNVQLPYNLQVDVPGQVGVRVGTRLSNRIDVTSAAAMPAIFTVTGETGAVPNAANPVLAGQRLTILCEGLGQVNATVDVGFPGPSPAAEPLNPPTVAIGGRPAAVRAAFLIPGLAGIYQVEAIVPEGIAAADDVPLTVSSAGLSSNAVRIAVR